MNRIFNNNSGTALLMTLLVLNIVMIVSLASAKIIVSGIKISGVQSKSGKAYFAAESGMEKLLWSWRKDGLDISNIPSGTSDIFSKNFSDGSSYQVDRPATADIIFRSTGDYQNLKRTVEIQLDF